MYRQRVRSNMAKIAGRSYPGDLDPDEADKWADTLVNEFGGHAESKEAFAQSVGHKSTSSGTFKRKVADARKYGLLTPRGDYEATDLGFRLANPENSEERHETIFQMLENVPILSDLYDTLNGSEPPDEFWRILTEITDANPKEARESAEWIENLYSAMLEADRYLDQRSQFHGEGDESREESDQTKESSESDRRPPSEIQPESALYVKVGNDEIRFEDVNDVNIELAQRFLDTKKEDTDDESQQMKFS